jgi:hypothetical protein
VVGALSRTRKLGRGEFVFRRAVVVGFGLLGETVTAEMGIGHVADAGDVEAYVLAASLVDVSTVSEPRVMPIDAP